MINTQNARVPVPVDPNVESDPFALQRDPLSDILELIRVRGYFFYLCGRFAIRDSLCAGQTSPAYHSQWSVVISVDGLDEVFHASQGDLVMLTHGDGHTICDQRGRDAHAPLDLAEREYDRERLVLGQGETTWLCGDFASMACWRAACWPFCRAQSY